MTRFSTLTMLLSSAALAACSHGDKPPPQIKLAPTAQAATVAVREPTLLTTPVQIVEVPTPLPLPGQLKPLPADKPAKEPRDPRARVAAANDDARIEPTRSGYVNAVQVYPFTEGALYQLYAAPGQVTDIALQSGEQLVGNGPVAAGDTTRWVIGDTTSGSGATARIHILVKPIRAGVATNLVINTDRRTYHLELRSAEKTYMASVSWSYLADELIALRRNAAAAEAAQPVAVSTLEALASLNFGYRISGDKVPWRPVRVFDDGKQTFVEFPAGIGEAELPPLWVIGATGEPELVNTRVSGRYVVVDRLFSIAELRLGAKKQKVVRIERTEGRRR